MSTNKRPCYAPVFKPGGLACIFLIIILAVIYALLLLFLIWTESGRCYLRQLAYRINNCFKGNSNPELPI